MPPRPKPNRILLKLSGEALMGDQTFGIDDKAVSHFAAEIADVARTGTEIAVVIGGGNIFRGLAIAAKGGDRVTGDHMGMLATVMNALALEAALVREGLEARALSAIEMPSDLRDLRAPARRLAHEQEGDRGAGRRHRQSVLHDRQRRRAACARARMRRAPEGNAGRRRLFRRPAPRPAAPRRYEHVTFQEAISRGLAVMDTAAFALARDNGLPIIVFNIHEPGALARIVAGEAGRHARLRRLTAPAGQRWEDETMERRHRFQGPEPPHARRRLGAEDRAFGPADRARLGQPARSGHRQRLRLSRCRSTRSATVNVPEPRMLSVQVWDKSLAGAVDRAIREANLGLNPIMEGTLLRIPIPELNAERRQEMVKVGAQICRAGAHRRPPRAARRHGQAEEAREGRPSQPGRHARTNRRSCRS